MPEHPDPGAPVTTDTLLLASALRVPRGTLVVELGCGVGAVMERASVENPGCTWIGLDIRLPALVAMLKRSRRWAGENSGVHALCCPVRDVPLTLSGSIAGAVMMNPPFMNRGHSRTSPSSERAVARSGSSTLLLEFVRAAAHLLVPGGRLVAVCRPFMLPDMLLGFRTWKLGAVELKPVGYGDRPAEHVLLHSVKGSSRRLSILPWEVPGT